MKNLIFKTNNGNRIVRFDEKELIILKNGNVKHNTGSFFTKNAIEKELYCMPINAGEELKIYSFLYENQNKKSKLVENLQVELNKYKSHFGNIPEWLERNFKSEKHYLKYQEKKLIKNLQKEFKLKTQKAVKKDIVRIYTVEYTGKNNGYKHFNRSLNFEYDLKENISDYNRRKNLAVTDILGNIIELRGNISKDDI